MIVDISTKKQGLKLKWAKRAPLGLITFVLLFFQTLELNSGPVVRGGQRTVTRARIPSGTLVGGNPRSLQTKRLGIRLSGKRIPLGTTVKPRSLPKQPPRPGGGGGGGGGGKPGKDNYDYAGAWKGYKKGSNGIGIGAATLISPNWAITAYHVASKQIQNPKSVNVQIRFGKQVIRGIKKCYRYPGGADVALVHLKLPVSSKVIKPVSLCKTKLTKKHGTFAFTFVSRAHSLKVVKNRHGKSNGTGITMNLGNGRPGKAGDSGCSWVKEQKAPKQDIQLAVLHGGGMAPQVAHLKPWIDKTVAKTGDKVNWVAFP